MRASWFVAVAVAAAGLAPAGYSTARGPRSTAIAVAADPIAPPSCGPGDLPDRGVCVTPSDEDGFTSGDVAANSHHDRSGRHVVYDQIPRRPDRPADYDAYRYPIPPGLAGGHAVVSGYDLDAPDARQRRGRTLHAVGHGGVDLPQARGTNVKAIALDHQVGDAEVVFVGKLFGLTVVTRHTLHEATGDRDHILIHGHLDAVAAGVTKGAVVHEGDALGAVGDSGSPELVHLHLESRRMREGRDARASASPEAMLDESIPVDPRNVLPMR